jgi:hypothetical protein
MGEYAIRKSDGADIKIGTCETMYYLRYSDRDKVKARSGNIDPMDESIINQIRWRLPYPDEDHIQPGDYEPFRGAMLYGFENPDTVNEPGILQKSTKYGLLMNIPCYHGEKLPENYGEIKVFWNGKGPAYELRHLKFIDGEPWGVYGCIECGQEWRAPLKELIPFIGGDNHKVRARLIEWYCPDICEKKEEGS